MSLYPLGLETLQRSEEKLRVSWCGGTYTKHVICQERRRAATPEVTARSEEIEARVRTIRTLLLESLG